MKKGHNTLGKIDSLTKLMIGGIKLKRAHSKYVYILTCKFGCYIKDL